jgi:hypothetical protein
MSFHIKSFSRSLNIIRGKWCKVFCTPAIDPQAALEFVGGSYMVVLGISRVK